MLPNESYSVLSVNYKVLWFVGYENLFLSTFVYVLIQVVPTSNG